MQAHFRSHMLERTHQKVGRAHPELERTEGMLDRLPSYPHQIRTPIQPLLHGLEYGLVLPTLDAVLR